ncbi:hypothetical protein PFISCL1PPCAC_12393, partial [Pristionchus fissidentatus]
IFQASRLLMNSVDSFFSCMSNTPNISSIVFEKYKIPGKYNTRERAGYDVHIFTYPKNVPMIDLSALRYRITEKRIVDTDEGEDWKDGYRLSKGKLARITIPVRSHKDPVIPYIADLIGTKTENIIVTRLRNYEDFTIVRNVLEGTDVQ